MIPPPYQPMMFPPPPIPLPQMNPNYPPISSSLYSQQKIKNPPQQFSFSKEEKKESIQNPEIANFNGSFI